MTDYQEKIQREQAWYGVPEFQQGHFLNSWPFDAPERGAFSDRHSKGQFASYIREALDAEHLTNPRMLLAPSGSGYDLPFLRPLSQRIAGIDISATALAALPDGVMEKHLGDIKHMTMFEDNRFDVVVMSQFFHHFVQFGFDEFLLEARRVLRPGGHWFSFEPSILHPFALAAWCCKKVFGNFTGCVEDESPFYPGRLTAAMKRCGLRDVTLLAASYSHQRMPVPLARVIHATTRPLLRVAPFTYFAWGCVFHGRKPL